MKYTTNYALEKPDPNDVVDIRVINRNMDKMDAEVAKKVDKVAGKGLSTEDYTTAEKAKLAGIEENANNYIHPSTHPASIITQDSTHRFVTDSEKNTWNAKLDAYQFTSNNVLTKLKAVDGAGSGLDADTIDGWQFYRDVSELGLTAGTETINSIVEAMPGKSVLITGIGSSHNSSEYPTTLGTLRVFRIDDSRTVLEFDINKGTPKKWIGNYYMEQKFSGWKEVISQFCVMGEYAGNSVAGRKIVLGFQPYFVWVVPMSSTSSARGGFIFSNGAYTLRGDTYVNTFYADSGVTTTSDGFYVQGAYMNTSGYSYKYFAFK